MDSKRLQDLAGIKLIEAVMITALNPAYISKVTTRQFKHDVEDYLQDLRLADVPTLAKTVKSLKDTLKTRPELAEIAYECIMTFMKKAQEQTADTGELMAKVLSVSGRMKKDLRL